MFLLKDKLKYHHSIFKNYGIKANLFLVVSKFKKNKINDIRISEIPSTITLSNFNNDVSTLFKIFFSKEYDITLKSTPSVIIDCGANIGLSAIFFANKYPSATIIALEPDRGNFKYLEKNTNYFKNVICINKAVWSHSTIMSLVDEGSGNWGLKTYKEILPGAVTVEAVSIEEIIHQFNLQQIDLVKIDIEGAEKELFSRNYENWLKKTKVIAIELHDRDDAEIADVFYKALEPLRYKKTYKGENLICDFTS